MLRKIFAALGHRRIYICKGRPLGNGEFTGPGVEVTGI